MDQTNHPDYPSAVMAIRTIFGDKANFDKRPVQEVYVVGNRTGYSDAENVLWLRGNLAKPVELGLVRRFYTATMPRRLESIQLTANGKRILSELLLIETRLKTLSEQEVVKPASAPRPLSNGTSPRSRLSNAT